MAPISTAELAALVAAASRQAAPQEQDAAARAAQAIHDAGVHADLASDGSRFLANVVEICGPYLTVEAQRKLRAVRLYGVDTAYPNAIPQQLGAERRIFVFDGLQQQILYVTELLKVLMLLQTARPDAEFDDDGEVLPEALAFSMSGFAILADSLAAHRRPAVVHDMLGPLAWADAMSAYRLAIAFVLLHELGHLELGHLTFEGVRSERAHLHLAEPEPLSAYQADELAADAFALDHIKPEYRAELMPSLCFFFLPYAFLEAFSGGLSAAHPLAVNRIAALANRADLPPETRRVVVEFVEARLEALRGLAGARQAAGGDLRSRMEARMPIARAYEILGIIKARVAAETGVLDRAQTYDDA